MSSTNKKCLQQDAIHDSSNDRVGCQRADGRSPRLGCAGPYGNCLGQQFWTDRPVAPTDAVRSTATVRTAARPEDRGQAVETWLRADGVPTQAREQTPHLIARHLLAASVRRRRVLDVFDVDEADVSRAAVSHAQVTVVDDVGVEAVVADDGGGARHVAQEGREERETRHAQPHRSAAKLVRSCSVARRVLQNAQAKQVVFDGRTIRLVVETKLTGSSKQTCLITERTRPDTKQDFVDVQNQLITHVDMKQEFLVLRAHYCHFIA